MYFLDIIKEYSVDVIKERTCLLLQINQGKKRKKLTRDNFYLSTNENRLVRDENRLVRDEIVFPENNFYFPENESYQRKNENYHGRDENYHERDENYSLRDKNYLVRGFFTFKEENNQNKFIIF
jgi:hypothetical protein